MNKLAVIGAILFACGAAQAQQANSPLYGEIGYTAAKYEEPGADAKPGLLRGILGYNAHPNVALEAMVGFGVRKDDINVLGTAVKAEVKNTYGFYVKPKFNVTNELEVFGRLGWAHSKVKASALGVSASDSGSDFSYGVGLNYSITPKAYVGLDYMSYYDKDDVKINGFTASVGFRF